ncbi:sugar phosphate isomerase/epimerase family protein [Bacillus sp. OTU530]|uniref:sugar phosphate isomerase/epimerase family protein n=1 Tax=Bacillus sp. OTU530 TaxID=3043862 RepID=UPI00313BEA92
MSNIHINQIAGMNLHYLRFPLEYFLNSMVKYEITNIELWGGYPHLYAEDVTLFELGKIRKKIEERNLKLVCYTPEQIMYANNIAAREPDVRKRSLAYYLKNIEIAAELGTSMMLITPGWGYYNEPIEAAWNTSRQSLAILGGRARELGVTLLLEPLQPFESNLITNLQQLKQILQELDMESIRGMLDIVAMAVAGDTISDYFQQLDHIRHIHLIDGNPSGHLVCGHGTLPLEQYVSEIASYDYSGYVSLELASSRYYTEPDQALAQSLEHVKRILLN